MATTQTSTQKRKVADCRNFPSEMNCTLRISGTEDEVVRAATEHAISVHGHQDSPELRERIRKMLQDEQPATETGEGPLHLIA
jgi:predicted small metal-binding protein